MNKFLDKYLDKRPKVLNNYLNIYGHYIIKSLIISRKPVAKIYQQILNIISLGEFNKNKKKYHYDNVFHLFMVLIFENGEKLKIEKNERINISKNTTLGPDNIYINNLNITFNELIINTEQKINLKDLYRYNAFSTNCQHFILSILKSNNILDDTAYKFILQSVGELISSNIIKHTTQGITDLAGISDYIIKGGIITTNNKLKNNINKLII